MRNGIRAGAICLMLCLLFGCAPAPTTSPVLRAEDDVFSLGYASSPLTYGEMEDYYIAGYHSGEHPTGIHDPQAIDGVWIECGEVSMLVLSVDCIGLTSAAVAEIREALAPFCESSGCGAVHVVSTHTHAGADTMGLWGPIGINGKNESFLAQIVALSCDVAEAAYADRQRGQLYYSATPTEKLQEDSRDPQQYDANLYQLRFAAEDSEAAGIRILSFGAHAESLRGDNRLISADYPGLLCDLVEEESGDRTMFLPGAVGGLIYTPLLEWMNAVWNLEETAKRLSEIALSPAEERLLTPSIALATRTFETPLDNTLFLYLRFLGILENETRRDLRGQYYLTTEVSAVTLGDVTLALLPGEIFPELVSGTGNAEDPEALREIAARHGRENLVVIGLANDEVGYIVPPSDFVLHAKLPYIEEADGHYEETNAASPAMAADLAAAFDALLEDMQ